MSDPASVFVNVVVHDSPESAADATVESLRADAAVVVLRGESAEANTPASIEELRRVAAMIHAAHPAHPLVVVLPFGVGITTAEAVDSAAFAQALRAASDADLEAMGLVRIRAKATTGGPT